MRFALLYAQEVLVPAGSYHEHPLCKRTVDAFAPLFDTGLVRFVGGAPNMQLFAESKLEQYRPGTPLRDVYEAARLDDELVLPFLQRPAVRTTTEDLHAFWHDTAELRGFPDIVFGRRAELPRRFDTLWSDVPDRLGAEAFIPEYVAPVLFEDGASPMIESRLAGLINEGYFASYGQAYQAGFVTDLVLLNSTHKLLSTGVDVPFHQVQEAMRRRNVLELVATCKVSELIDLREHDQVVMALTEVLRGEVDLTDPDQLVLPLGDEPDLPHLAAEVTRVRPGREQAKRYHHAIEQFFTAPSATRSRTRGSSTTSTRAPGEPTSSTETWRPRASSAGCTPLRGRLG